MMCGADSIDDGNVLLPGIGERAFIDIDSLLRPVYRHHKQAASFGHAKIASRARRRRGLSPQITTIPTARAQYVEREQIFYATGETREQLLKSPHLEAFNAKGYEVLLLTDAVDEIWVGSVTEFDGKRLQSVAKGEVDLDSDEEKAAHEAGREEQDKDFADLLTWLKGTLSDHVKEVRFVDPPDRVAGLPPVRLVVAAMVLTMASWPPSGGPRQFIEMCKNSRCWILFPSPRRGREQRVCCRAR